MKKNGFTIIELLIASAVIGILAAIAIPAYSSYIARAKISEGYSYASFYTVATAEYYQEHGTFPNSLNQLNINGQEQSSRFVNKICLQNSGAFQAIFDGDPIKGALQYVPEVTSGGAVRWSCYGIEIPEKYIPTQCQNTDITYNKNGLLIINRVVNGASTLLAYGYPCPEYASTSTASVLTDSGIDFVQNMYVYMRDNFGYSPDKVALVYNSYSQYFKDMQESWKIQNPTDNPYRDLQCGSGYSPGYNYGIMIEVGNVSTSGVCPASAPIIWNCQRMVTKNGVTAFEVDPTSRWTCGPRQETGLIY